MRIARTVLALVVCPLGLLTLAACNSDGRTLRPAAPDQTASVYTTTTSSTIAGDVSTTIPGAIIEPPQLAFVLNLPWEEGAAIDPRYTCNGTDVQPGFSWLGAPADAVEMALVVTDDDAEGFVHWVIAGLDPNNPFVGENSVPVSAIEALNDFAPAEAGAAVGSVSDADIGWRGPCPPAGTTHRYRFSLYALSQPIELPTGSAAADLIAAINATSLSVAERTGVYLGN